MPGLLGISHCLQVNYPSAATSWHNSAMECSKQRASLRCRYTAFSLMATTASTCTAQVEILAGDVKSNSLCSSDRMAPNLRQVITLEAWSLLLI